MHRNRATLASSLPSDTVISTIVNDILNEDGVSPRVQTLLDDLKTAVETTNLQIHVMRDRIAQMEERCHIDDVTGLMNGHGWRKMIKSAAARHARSRATAARGLLSLVGLDALSAPFGANASDEILRQVAVTLNQELRQTDILAHMGEGRFAVLLENCSAQNGQARLEALAQTVSATPAHIKAIAINLHCALDIQSFGPTQSLYLS